MSNKDPEPYGKEVADAVKKVLEESKGNPAVKRWTEETSKPLKPLTEQEKKWGEKAYEKVKKGS